MLFSEDLVSQWLEDKKGKVKTSSYLQYQRTAATITRELSDVEISRSDCGLVVYQKLSTRYSARTIRYIVAIINQILYFGHKNGQLLAYQPISIGRKITHQSRINVMTACEQRKLTQYLIKNIDASKFGVLICLYTGIRLGELCGLKWEDFDIKRKCFNVRRSIQRVGEIGRPSFFIVETPKTVASVREIPFPPALQDIIIYRCKSQKQSHYIASDNDNFVQPRTYQNRFKSYCKESGIAKYHFHTLRHTFATRAIELGCDPKTLSEILGHSNISITLQLYTHPSLEAKAKEMKKFSKFIKNGTQN